MRGKSWIGGFSMKSTSFASSAATRDAALVIGRRITFFHFGFVPQWVSFSSMTMRSPGVNWVYLNGPVPAYFILLKSSVFGQAATPSQPALLNFRSSGAPPFLAEMMAMLLDRDRHQRERFGGGDDDGVRIGRRHGVDHAGRGDERGRRVLHLRHTAIGEDHVAGGEVRAVGEFHALAQLELPGLVVDRAIALGKARTRLLVLVLVGQPLIDLGCDLVVRTQRMIVRVDRARLGGQADAKFLRSGRRKQQKRCGQRGCRGKHRATDEVLHCCSPVGEKSLITSWPASPFRRAAPSSSCRPAAPRR